MDPVVNRTPKPKSKLKPRRLMRPRKTEETQSKAPVADLSTEINPPVTKPKEATPTKSKFPPLTKEEHKFLSDVYYKHGGYRGRDQMFEYLKRHYDKNNTPKKNRISRRRMWSFFLKRQ